MGLIREICARLDFLPVRLHPDGSPAGEDAWNLSDNSARINVSVFKSDIWKIMAGSMIEEKQP